MARDKMNESVLGDPTNADGEDTASQSTGNSQTGGNGESGGNGENGGSERTLEDLRAIRRPARRRFLHLEAEILGIVASSRPDLDRLLVLQKEFQQVYDEVLEQNDSFLVAMSKANVSDDEADVEYKLMAEYRQKAKEICAQIEKMGAKAQKKNEAATAAINSGRKFKLPEKKLLSFSGEIGDWLPYWGQFQRTIDENPDLDNAEKFLYLLDTLPEGTDAYKLVSRFPRGEDYYKEAVDQLKKRYANPNILTQYYASKLMSLVLINASSHKKMPLANLFVEVDVLLRALDSLNWANADPKTLLVPLLEGALPNYALEKWQRSDAAKVAPFGKDRMKALMGFMSEEVEAEDRVKQNNTFTGGLLLGGVNRGASTSKGNKQGPSNGNGKGPYKAMGFHVGTKRACCFCSSFDHANRDCPKAIKVLTFEEKMKILREKGLCFTCTLGHRPRACRFNKDNLVCSHCGKGHMLVLCKEASGKRKTGASPPKRPKTEEPPQQTVNNNNQVGTGEVVLQTLRANVCNGNRIKNVRVFYDTGSSRSYILKSTAITIGLIPKSEETAVHSLFGSSTTNIIDHKVYDVQLLSENKNSKIKVTVRDHNKICSSLRRLDWIQARFGDILAKNNIKISDLGKGNAEVELMIGADMYGRLVTGKKIQISESLFAFETIIGWTLIGEVDSDLSMACQTFTMTTTDTSLCKLWDLDLLGIRDSLEVLSEKEKELKAKRLFMGNVTRNPDGRYVVRLPFKESHPHPPSNKNVAIKRLECVSRKLKTSGLLGTYNKLFEAWLRDEFIEMLDECSIDKQPHHYLPHRAVVKVESLTTPVRPVFDASCKIGGNLSLNDCLYKGQAYVQLIPDRILKFRERPIGFISDIKKAFQMIEVHEDDRDFLRFFWWNSKEMNNFKIFRHKRVPFGATCSPFILNAILEHHLQSVNEQQRSIADKLWGTLYVDNCSSSEDTVEEYLHFKQVSIDILAEAKMDLRMWLSNVENVHDMETRCVSVLGIKWDRKSDELFLDLKGIEIPEKVTKRTVLSTASKIFDPIGFAAPAILPMKLLLQRTWLNKLSWDEELPTNEKREFLNWCAELESLHGLRIPRLISAGSSDHSKWELHTFTDGSKFAYGAVCYLKTYSTNRVELQLLAAKARVAPTKPLTIPRLELLGCLIGARLANEVKTALNLNQVKEFYHTDSTTALAWINRNDQYGTFVGNRTNEINKLTKRGDWRHLPGKINPADLPSRGCSPGELVGLRWFEGPAWLKSDREEWPDSSIIYNEEEIEKERRKTPVKTVLSNCCIDFGKDYSFKKIVRIQAWVRRFLDKCRKQKHELFFTLKELRRAENDIVRKIQHDVFEQNEKELRRLKTLETIVDENGVIRVQTRITHLKDVISFKQPAVLPGGHPLVKQLIKETHIACCHAGVGFVMTTLRNKYWILKARQSVKKVTTRCPRCRRYSARATITPTAPLPIDRIRSAEVFEVSGVDLAGPFCTRNGKKVWTVLYTCAVYRAVHLDLIGSLSTKEFVKSLGRFVDNYRRPAVIYSDNGTNFKGAYHLFKRLDWALIQEFEKTNEIEWRFNPPTAAWWGGWWERLIKTMKDLLRKEIGQALMNRSELVKILKTIEEVMNHRPLTYISEDLEDLEPLTPALFLRPLGNINFPEIEFADGEELRKRYKYLKTLQGQLKMRFKKEYISLLINRNPKTVTRPLRVGELVVVGNDNKKRNQWPLGRILELIPGKDGVASVAKVKTEDGVFTRPVQRLYPLEADTGDVIHKIAEVKTRSGRIVQPPRSQ